MTDETELVELADLSQRGVAKVAGPHGTLAVGMASGRPFAVSNRCRHLGASLGDGRVTADGCLKCPWHGAEYDVTSGTMTSGPEGAVFRPVRAPLRAMVNAFARLRRYPVVARDGAIYLDRA